MIPRANITAWRVHTPWADESLVEQDLVISRALVEVFRVKAIAKHLALRGGALSAQEGARPVRPLARARTDAAALLRCFMRCMTEGGYTVTRAQFEANLHEKAADGDFRAGIRPLLRPGIHWDFDAALALVHERIIESLPGDPWKGPGNAER